LLVGAGASLRPIRALRAESLGRLTTSFAIGPRRCQNNFRFFRKTTASPASAEMWPSCNSAEPWRGLNDRSPEKTHGSSTSSRGVASVSQYGWPYLPHIPRIQDQCRVPEVFAARPCALAPAPFVRLRCAQDKQGRQFCATVQIFFSRRKFTARNFHMMSFDNEAFAVRNEYRF